MAAGFIDFEIAWSGDVFAGAPQASSAAAYGTLGINFFAREPLDQEERDAYLVSQQCELPAR